MRSALFSLKIVDVLALFVFSQMRFTTSPFLSRNSTEIICSGFNIQNVA